MTDIEVPDAGLSPPQRQAVLDTQVQAMTAAGYRVVMRIDHLAVFERDGSDRVEIFIDGDGDIRYA